MNGRPKKRWRDEVEADLNEIGVRDWRGMAKKAQNEIALLRKQKTNGCQLKENGERAV